MVPNNPILSFWEGSSPAEAGETPAPHRGQVQLGSLSLRIHVRIADVDFVAGQAWLDRNLYIFEADLTCCRTQHRTIWMCDKVRATKRLPKTISVARHAGEELMKVMK